MKIKQMAEDIRSQMPKDLNELETLRYIYIYLGKQKSFDPKYYFGTEEARKKIYRLSMQNLRNEDFLTNNKNLICTSIASTLVYLGKEFDIDVDIMKEEDNRFAHMYNIAKLKDGRIIRLDLQQDLRFIHTGQSTECFGNQEYLCTKLDGSMLEKIDEKIGYKQPGKDYSEDILVRLALGMRGKSEMEKVKILLSNNDFNEMLKEEGYSELERFMDTCMSAIGAFNSNIITCYRDLDINKQILPERQYSMCILAQEEKQKEFDLYMFKKKERKFVEVTIDQMKRLVGQGMKFESKSNLSGVKRLKTILDSKGNALENR